MHSRSLELPTGNAPASFAHVGLTQAFLLVSAQATDLQSGGCVVIPERRQACLRAKRVQVGLLLFLPFVPYDVS